MVSQSHGDPLLIIDFGVAVAVAVLAFGLPTIDVAILARLEQGFSSLASRRGLSVLIVGLSVLLLRIVILPINGIPFPILANDFSFLLSADTFAHGRLTNPTPAMWTHFESIHITMIPTYQSMYFPGPGLMMAASQVIFGHPWWGILFASALMCAALTWALQAWVPANWALLGGIIAVLRLGLTSSWTNSYFASSSLSALAGALVLGALPRLKRTAQMRHGLLMGVGIAILELTRPYEGVLLCIPVAAALAHWIWKGKHPPSMVLVRRALLPLLLVAGASAWLGYYDLNAFGKVTTLPYTLDRAQYATTPYYVWQHPRPVPNYRHAVMRDFYRVIETEYAQKLRSPKGFILGGIEKIYWIVLFYAGFTLLLPMIMLRRVIFDRRIRFMVVCLCVLAAGVLVEIFLLPYYVAPFLVVFYAIGLQAMRHLRLWKSNARPIGLTLVRLIILSSVATTALRVVAQPLHLLGPDRGIRRVKVQAQLETLPGPQLAIVRYGPSHGPQEEWVYNAADIENAKVIWAREMAAADNLELVRYYKNRTVWLIEPDIEPARVSRYPMLDSANDLKK